MGFLSKVVHGGPEYQAKKKKRQELKEAERQAYEETYNIEKRKALRERGAKEGREAGLRKGPGIGGSVLAGIKNMGEGVSFNTSNPVIFGGEGAPSGLVGGGPSRSRKKRKKTSTTSFSIEHMF